MKIKTSALTGKALAYAAFCAEGMSFYHLRHCKYPDDHQWVMHGDGTIRNAVEVPSNAMSRRYDYTYWSPHEDWSQGGPILTKAKISRTIDHSGLWLAYYGYNYADAKEHMQCDRSELVAAMRCFVASRLGDEVDVPEELL